MSNITMGPGTLYFGLPGDDTLHPLGEVAELNLAEAVEEKDAIKVQEIIRDKAMGATFEITLTKQQMENLYDVAFGITRIVYEMIGKYKSGDRVCYLALHHKKARVRKKNWRRAYQMVEKEARKHDK